MLFELAIADAYGAGFEFNSEGLKYNDLSRYIKHPKHKGIPGRYTDDTQQSLAIAEAILEDDPWTAQSLASRLVEVFRRDPRKGYSSRVYSVLTKARTGSDLIMLLDSNSKSCGAAMRSVPIGLFKTEKEVLEKAALQAKITHNTSDAILSSQAVALLSHFFIYDLGEARKDLVSYLQEWLPAFTLGRKWKGKVSSDGLSVARAAISTILHCDARTLSALLQKAISFGGDVDSVAAIAVGVASCSSQQFLSDLPEHLILGLEDGDFGGTYLKALDEKLLTKYL